ncbi:MAG TPA: Amuc_1100 family pilus-like protein, partial [Candidatus Udaeobacter sp.]|nr:Amuc_1100 family pilus-like protein [Candidatus Udaeobacter sp.]
MKLWFQQNRALGTLLIVFGIGALFAGILLYWRWATWSDARQTFDQAAAERTRLQQLDPFPNDANYRKSQGYLDRYSTALNKFKDELKNGVVPAPPLAPNEFQSRLRLATVATVNRAQTNNVKLPDKFELGFDEFATGLPDTTVAPLLGQELSQVQMLMNILLDAKVDSVISLHRAPLPEERKSLSTRTPSPATGRTATKTGTPPPTA